MAESKLLWFISFFPLWTTPMILLNRNGDLSSLTRFPRILEISRWTCCLSHMLEQAMFSTYEYVVRIMTIYDVCSAYTNDNIIYIFRTKYTIWLSRATNGSNFHFFHTVLITPLNYYFSVMCSLFFLCSLISFASFFSFSQKREHFIDIEKIGCFISTLGEIPIQLDLVRVKFPVV